MISSPPRAVPLSSRLQVLFGGAGVQLAWFLLCFGLIFFWIFTADALITAVRLQGEFKATQGVVRSSHRVGTQGSRKRGHEQAIMANEVGYRVNGRPFQIAGYTTGYEAQHGSQVNVFYKPDHPEIARVEGMRAAAFEGFGAMFPLIVVILGLLQMLFSSLHRLRCLRLLQRGEIIKARLLKRERTNLVVNNRRVWKLIFSYQVKGQLYENLLKTHMPETVTDEAEETLLYDPNRPQISVLLDSLPGGTRFGPDGNLQGPALLMSSVLLLQPALAVLICILGWKSEGL